MSAGGPPRLRLVGDAVLQESPAVLAAFPGDWLAPWLRARRRIEGAGYGETVAAAFRAAGPVCAQRVGPEPVIDMADTLSAVTIKSGRLAGAAFAQAAIAAAERLGDAPRFRLWLSLMQRFAALAPESALPVLERMGELLARVSVPGLEAWLLAGVRLAGVDADRRRAFFATDDPDAARLLAREAGETGFFDLERRLRAYLIAIHGLPAPIREAPPGRHDGASRRASHADGMIRMPAAFPGFHGPQAEALFRAALAHIGAHMRFSGPRFPVGQLKPLQVAVVSLVEDARVEHLAMREMPGLARLWLPFHIALASGVVTAPSLFARLARALIDPDFNDIDGWVRKGRDLFFAARPRWDDPGLSRQIGNLLGNDLGQMRVQFNAKTHVVQPPYRDDNSGLWHFGPDAAPPEAETEMLVDSARPRPDDSREPDQSREGGAPPQARARLTSPDEPDQGHAIARYPEYDYEAGRERPDWTTLVDTPVRPGPPRLVAEVLDRHAALADRLSAVIRAARIGRPRRLRRQAEGETLDLDACLDAAIALRAGQMPDGAVYQVMSRRQRDLAVSVLIDVSQSTADPVPGGGRVIDLEREAAILLAHAMDRLGDPFALAAFSSNGRDDVRYQRIKGFDDPFGPAAHAALAGLTPGYSTRLGAALRHAGRGLGLRANHRRLVLVVTDGEPADLDCPDPAYLVQDARRAVQSLKAQGIDVLCIGLGTGHTDTQTHIFGRRGFVQIARIAALPEKLPTLYLRLTA